MFCDRWHRQTEILTRLMGLNLEAPEIMESAGQSASSERNIVRTMPLTPAQTASPPIMTLAPLTSVARRKVFDTTTTYQFTLLVITLRSTKVTAPGPSEST